MDDCLGKIVVLFLVILGCVAWPPVMIPLVALAVLLWLWAWRAGDEGEKERLAERKTYWAQVNRSPWWRLGIPEKVSLVLDVDVLEDFSPEMELWFKMIEGNAEARDWHIVILEKAYHRIMASYSKQLTERYSRMQNCLGERLRVLHNTGTLGEYMTSEKVRPDVFFTKSVKSKIIIHELAQQNGLELAHEVRSPENWKSHFEGAGSSEITEECLSDKTD